MQIHLYEIPGTVKLLETESRMNGSWVGMRTLKRAQDHGGLLFNG